MYELIKYLHIILAAIIFGGYLLHILVRFQQPKLATNDNYQQFYRWHLKILIVPSLFLQLLTGLHMAKLAQFGHQELWISFSMAFVLLMLAGCFMELRKLKNKQLPKMPHLIGVTAVMLVVFYLMTIKPDTISELL